MENKVNTSEGNSLELTPGVSIYPTMYVKEVKDGTGIQTAKSIKQ